MSEPAQPGMHFDITGWPFVVITQVGACTDEQVAEYLEGLKRLYERNVAYALLLDLRRGVPFNSKQRQMQSAWLAKSRHRVHNIAGIAFVEDSILMRGAMQAAFWLNPPEYPYFVTSQLPPAREWVRKQFAARTRATG